MSADVETNTMGPASNSSSSGNDSNASDQTAKAEPSPTAAPSFPPPKTDKPRPHVCGTCQRPFARLEHLKRHERSHTKEKPFECPQCTRCFARRDLLLRHQQKLHQQGNTSSKPRNARRESMTGLPPGASARVRKNSIASINGGAGGAGPGMRPRANTISHIDPTALNDLLASHSVQTGRGPSGHSGHTHHPSLAGIGSPGAFDFRNVGNGMGVHGMPHGLPKLDTHLSFGMGGGLRTAPLPAYGPDDVELEKFFGSTINPNQLHHFGGAVPNSATPLTNNFANPFEDELAAWGTPMDDQMVFNGLTTNEQAVDGSSPSAFSSASQSGFSEVMLDGSGQPTSTAMWSNPIVSHSGIDHAAYSLDTMAPIFPELDIHPVSTTELGDQGTTNNFYHMSSAQPVSAMSPSAAIPGMPNQYFHPSMGFHSDTGSISSSSINGSARHSSVTSVSTDTITDATRQVLMSTLSQAYGLGATQRKFSQPQISSPLSAGATSNTSSQHVALPSTVDLQRYVNAYIQYFHPHFPFLHIPTLSFDTSAHSRHLGTAGLYNNDNASGGGGGGCLILAMAAIGALYEFDAKTAKELFEAAKKLILYYLDERRRFGLSAAVNGGSASNDSINKPPLWLVQAMLLNLIFGHNCGDKQAAEVASTHCAALVSLAKAAELDRPTPIPANDAFARKPTPDANGDLDMEDANSPSEMFQKATLSDSSNIEHAQWIQWKTAEERKRTYLAAFSMSSLLVSAYAHAPRILNSEIRLDLPCEEDLWAADSAQTWVAMNGPAIAQSPGLSFNYAMTYLLEASTRQQSDSRTHGTYSPNFGGSRHEDIQSEIRPSTFGCYVLINALHVYIWETRQRHNGRLWKAQETEAMHAQVEPALKAWQAAWHTNPRHSLARSSPYGPLAADCIPLLDLAYIRLFVNLVRSKEFLWQRDFSGMATELARGIDIIPQAEGSPDPGNFTNSPFGNNTGGAAGRNGAPKRERHLRKAAFYAADSLLMAEETGAAYGEIPAREMPNSAAMCTFDCSQVLAEWVATVQDRVGCNIGGVLGKDNIDLTTVPAVIFLEDEDIKLLHKIQDILHKVDMRLAYEVQGLGSSGVSMLSELPNLGPCGYGTKLLVVTAFLLKRAAVWPVTRIMAHALEAHASLINQRAEASVVASQ